MKLTEFFVKRPVLFWSLMAFVLIAGVLAFVQMPKLEDPAVSTKQAMVVVAYPGASAHEVELKVAQMVEDELRALPDVKKIRTECQNGVGLFTVEFKLSVQNEELEQHFDYVRRKVNDLAMRLPQDCYAPIVIDDMTDVYGIVYALTSDGYTYPEMNRYAEFIRRELLGVEGVKRISIFGNRDEVINIMLSTERLTQNGVIPTQIMTALQAAGKTVNAGKYANGEERISVYVDDAIKDENDISELLIQSLDGKKMRLGDVATIERTYAEPQTNAFFINGKPALAICVAMENDAIVPEVGKKVDERLAEIMPAIPVGLETDKLFFQPDKVNQAVSSFMVNLLESVLIVILVLVFTMGLRSGLIIGFGLVLTVAISFPILLLCGTTLQRISLGAFIVAMGMLVDNAVVIMDGILVDKKRGLREEEYLYRIGKNTALPLLGATIIAASTFMCVYLSPDSVGEYAGDLFVVLCVSLLASWFLALVQVPVCAKEWLPKNKKYGESKELKVADSKVHRFFRRMIEALIAHRKITIATAVVILAVSIFGLTKAKNLFFPDFDYKQFVVECFFPSATDANIVRDRLLEMSDSLSQRDGIERVAVSTGSAPAHYCLVTPMTAGGDCYGELIIDCPDYRTTLTEVPAIREFLRENYPDAYVRIRRYNFSISTSHTIEVEFAGPDPAVLRRLSRQAEDIMRRSEYIDPYSVQNNWKPRGKSYVAKYVQPDAMRAGVNRSDVANALLAATDGLPVGVINDHNHMVQVKMQLREPDGSKISDLTTTPVWSMANFHMSDEDLNSALQGGDAVSRIQDKMFRSVPLGSVTNGVDFEWDEDIVLRLNGQRVIEAECDPNPNRDDATPAKAVASIQDEINRIELPPGYSMRWVGEGEIQGEAIGNIMKYVPITILIILVILLLLFNSWKKLALILICFPFVICGIAPALLLSHVPLTFMAIIGLMGLIGMMTKNGIVLVDEINRLQKEGEHPYNAVVNATISRVRPVLMASLTTIVGMIPLVADPMYSSMAIVIMGGLSMGTIITLLLLPLLYSTFYNVRKPNNQE